MTEKKEVRFIIFPPRKQSQSQPQRSAQSKIVLSSDDDDDVDGRNRSAEIGLAFTAKVPLALCLSCCSTLRNLTEMVQAAADASAAFQQHAAAEEDDNDDEKNQQQHLMVQNALTSGLTGGASFYTELPSCMPMELPPSAASDMLALRLFTEYHVGADPDLAELSEVRHWGTERETATAWVGSSSSSGNNNKTSEGAPSNPLNAFSPGSAAAASSSASASSSSQRRRGRRRGGLDEFGNLTVEHGNLAPLSLEDRNPGVVFSAVHGVLPAWERNWVLDNFLSLDSPACCARAAKVAALAEYMGCVPLVQLMGCVMAARLCERPNPTVPHFQYCLLGKTQATTTTATAAGQGSEAFDDL